MIRYIALFLLVAGLARAETVLDIQSVTTPKNITVWFVRDARLPLMTVQFSVKGGAQGDESGKEGTSELLSTLLDEGAGTRDAEAFQNDLDRHGIRMRFSSGKDHFSGGMKTTTRFQGLALDLFDDALNKPHLDAEAIERMRQGLLGNLRFMEEDPNWIAGKVLFEKLFPDHPYGRVAEGTKESLKKITRDDVLNVKNAQFCRSGLHVSMVGNLDKKQVQQIADRLFGAWPECPMAQKRPQLTLPVTPIVADVERGGTQTVLIMAQQGLKRQDKDWWAARILDFTLGGGEFSSRLMQEIRVKRGFTYGISSTLAPYDDAQLWMIQAGLDPKHRDEAVALIQKIWGDVAQNGITKEEMEEAKAYMIGSLPLLLTTTDQIAGTLLQLQEDGLLIDVLDRRSDEINAVTLQDIKRVAAARLQPAGLTRVTVGPKISK